MCGFANAISCARFTARGQCGQVGVVNTWTVIGVSTAATSERLSADSVEAPPPTSSIAWISETNS